MDKQIEEMAKILCGLENGCDGCMFDKAYCNERNYAEEIYNAGYRKQSEVEMFRSLDCFKKEIMDAFLSLCNYNDYNNINLLLIGNTIDRIYEDVVSKMKGGAEE